jgi:hypothetical protein
MHSSMALPELILVFPFTVLRMPVTMHLVRAIPSEIARSVRTECAGSVVPS